MKRAGIIVGVVFIVVAIILNVGIQRRQSSEDGVGGVKEELGVTEEQREEVEKEPVEVVKEVVKVETKEISSIVEISEEDIGEYELHEEILIVESKKLLVLDMDTDGLDDKAIVYVLKSKDSRGLPITMVVNEVAYDGKKVGDRLQVKYKVMENSKGVKFAAIERIKEVEK